MLKNIFFVLSVFGFSAFLSGQEITFKALTDKTEVSVNERFVVQFLLTYGQENVSIDKPINIPDFGGLHQLGESTINRFQLSNGVAFNQVGIEAILVADREGTYTIGSASISINGKQFKTKPIKITVKKGLKPVEPAGQRIGEAFITAEVSDDNPFVNQEVILTVKMYSRSYSLLQNLRNYKEPDFSDVIAKYVSEKIENDEKQVLIKGVTYVSKELARYIIFPQKTGEIEINPFSVSVVVSGFFGAESFPLSTESVFLNVRNLPTQGRPKNFSGAVGDFKMNTSVSKTNPKANETVNLEVEIVGSGNLNTLKTPEFAVPQNIESYAPKKRDAFDLRPGGLKGKVVVSHLLVPQYGGNYTIGPIDFNYFNPEKEKYLSLKSEPIQLTVSGPKPPAKDSAQSLSDHKSDSAKGQNLIEFPKSLNEVTERVSQSMEKDKNWVWGIAGLALLALIYFVFNRKSDKPGGEKTNKQVWNEFKSDTDKKLNELKKLAEQNNSNEFFSLQEQLLTQIGMHFSQTSLSDFTEIEVVEKLKARIGDLAGQWKNLLDNCKQSKYGLGSKNTDLKLSYKETETLWKSFQKYSA